MSTAVRVLFVCDADDDVRLLTDRLREADFAPEGERVDGAAAMAAALDRGAWDLVIADHVLRHWSAPDALSLLRARGLDLAFIIVSNIIGEEVVVAAMKAGADDYLLKGKLSRLPAAVRRALREAELRRTRAQTRQAVRESEARFVSFMQHLPGIAFMKDLQGRYVYANQMWEHLLQVDAGQSQGQTDYDLWPAATADQFSQNDRIVQQTGDVLRTVEVVPHEDGPHYWLVSKFPIADPRGRPVLIGGVGVDVTERKRAEEALAAEAEISAALARIGRELISSLDAPALLQRLCELTTEVLECETSQTLLWKRDSDAYVPVAGHGYDAETWEARRVLQIPRADLTALLARLDSEDVVSAAPRDLLRFGGGTSPGGAAAGLCMAVRRGTAISGIHIAVRRDQAAAFTSEQERVAAGIARLASLALDNARLIDELNRANRLKSDFVATISHELRTPLNVIMGYNQLLLMEEFGPLTEAQRETLDRLGESSEKLLELVNATLNLSRLEAGRLPVEWSEIHLADLLEEIEAETEGVRRKPGITWACEASGELPPVRSDRVKLKVVLKNLIDNAFKFSEQGAVRLLAAARNGGVEFAVSDTGIGIPAEAVGDIFESFRQVDNSLTRPYGGAGLGLYIVRRLLELLGGAVTVESEVGRGSTFRVWVPREPAVR